MNIQPLFSGKIKSELRSLSDSGKAKNLKRFFKTGKGECGEGDLFLGVGAPEQRKIAKKYFNYADMNDADDLLMSPFHEDRSTGLVILVEKFKRSDISLRKKIFNLYVSRADRVNNWDLVDLSAPHIIGEWLINGERKIIYRLARSKNIWERRMAIVSTMAFIKKGDLADTFSVARELISDKEDLIHKAVGWMLREAGKRKKEMLEDFLLENGKIMPRTALRYAIEKFPDDERKKFLSIGKNNSLKKKAR